MWGNEKRNEELGLDPQVLKVEAFGDTPADLELYALTEALAFFGDASLWVDPDYEARDPGTIGAASRRAAELGVKYVAQIRVQRRTASPDA